MALTNALQSVAHDGICDAMTLRHMSPNRIDNATTLTISATLAGRVIFATEVVSTDKNVPSNALQER